MGVWTLSVSHADAEIHSLGPLATTLELRPLYSLSEGVVGKCLLGRPYLINERDKKIPCNKADMSTMSLAFFIWCKSQYSSRIWISN